MEERKKLYFVLKFFNKIYVLIAFTAFAIIYFFLGIFFGLDFTDTFFHLNHAQSPPKGIMVYPILLSSLIIRGILELLGQDLLYLRFINASIFLIALLIPFFFIRTCASKNNIIFFIGCIIFLIAPLNANVLGYDSLSILINSLIFTFSIFYIDRRRNSVLVFLAILCSISVLIRLPNAVVVPILMIVIFYQERIHSLKFNLRLLKKPILFLLISLTGVFLCYLIYYKEWDVFYNASMGSISHNLESLFYKYILDSIKLLIFSTFIIGSYFIFKIISNRYRRHLAYVIVFLMYVIFIKIFLLKYSYPIFLTAIILSIIIIHFYTERGKNKNSEILIFSIFFSFLFINAIGSNLGLLKTSFLFLLLPFVLSLIPVRSINFWKLIFIILIPLSIFLKFYRTYEGQSVVNLNRTVDIEILDPIKTSKERSYFLNKVVDIVSQLKKNNFSVFFYGNKSHIFHYLYPNSTFEIRAIDQPLENLVFFTELEKKVKDEAKIAVFLIPSYTESDEVIEKNAVEAQLLKWGFKKLQRGSVNFYLKQDD